MDNNRVYQAKVLRDKIDGKNTPTIEEIVEAIILSSESILKKDEIAKIVEMKIGLSLDDSLIGAISCAIKNLEKKKVIKHHSHGFWERV